MRRPPRRILSKASRRLFPDDPRVDRRSLGYWDREACTVNLAGDYRYMTSGYYASQDMEAAGEIVHPTCKEILDSYVAPVFLEKARLAGLPVPAYYVTNGHFEPPVIIDSVNPFMSRQRVVLKSGHQQRVAKSLTRNFTYAICCQELPPGARVRYFHAVLGWCAAGQYRALAAALWRVFHMPLAAGRVIRLRNGKIALSGMQPLPFARLSARELGYVNTRVRWLT